MKSVFISGSTSGIGLAIAKKYAQEGYHVFINGRDSLKMDAALHYFHTNHYNVTPLLGDCGDQDTVDHFKSKILSISKGLDILVLNAGQSYYGLFNDMTFDQWQRIVQTNINSLFLLCRAFTPTMIANKKGSIVTISSIWGQVGASCEVAYSMTKGAVNAFTKALAKELAPSLIQVNGIACGWIDTPMNQLFSQDEVDSFTLDIPLGRLGTSDEVAHLCYQLTNNHFPYLIGQIITLDGGYL